MNQQLFLAADNSSLANFKAWAQAISDWLRTCGWTNTADTGQVNWGTIASVPASTYVYDMFTPGDGGTAFYVKIEYGYNGTLLQLIITTGTATDGSGTITTNLCTRMSSWATSLVSGIANAGATTRECNFGGDSGRVQVMMFRDGGGNYPIMFAIERLLDLVGADTSEGFGLYKIGFNTDFGWSVYSAVTSFVAGVNHASTLSCQTGWPALFWMSGGGAFTTAIPQGAMGGYAPVLPVIPVAGKIYGPCTIVAIGFQADWAEGTIYNFNDTYGNPHNYIFSKVNPFNRLALPMGVPSGLFMRVD